MNKLGEKSLKTLEYYEILEKLAGQAASQAAKEKCRALRPLDDHEQAELWLQQTTDAKDLMVRQGSPAFGGVRDVGEALSRAERGGMLNTRELLDIAGLLTNVRRVQDYYKEDEEGTVIDKLFLSLHPNRFLEEKITTAILDENEIADAASPELAEIRRHKRAAAAKGRQILQRIISSPSYRNVLQDALITHEKYEELEKMFS
jgi:DNA mismatch repair protein MutS2